MKDYILSNSNNGTRIPNFTRLFSLCSRIEKLELDIDIKKYSEAFTTFLAAARELPISKLILSSGDAAIGFTRSDK